MLPILIQSSSNHLPTILRSFSSHPVTIFKSSPNPGKSIENLSWYFFSAWMRGGAPPPKSTIRPGRGPPLKTLKVFFYSFFSFFEKQSHEVWHILVCSFLFEVHLLEKNVFFLIRAYLCYIEPEGRKSSALYQNPSSTRKPI